MEARAVVLLALIVVAAGCVDQSSTSIDRSKGLEIKKFSISDTELTTGQQAVVTLRLQNHHTGNVKINDISLYNTGILNVKDPADWKKHCSPAELQPAMQGQPGNMQCTWYVTAPEDIGSFDSKPVTFNLDLEYSSELSNGYKPYRLQFRPADKIEKTSEKKKTYSNGEVKITVSSIEPLPLEGGRVKLQLEPAGPGNVKSGYTLGYSPSTVFTSNGNCGGTASPATGDTVKLSCGVRSATESAAVRNLVFSTSYKYVKTPSLDIEVVDR